MDVWLELFFLERFPHPDKDSYAFHTRPSATYRLKKYMSFKKGLRTIGRSYMNVYQCGGTSQGKIVPIKRHFVSLIFGIFLHRIRNNLRNAVKILRFMAIEFFAFHLEAFQISKFHENVAKLVKGNFKRGFTVTFNIKNL